MTPGAVVPRGGRTAEDGPFPMVGYDEELLADRSTANRPAEDAPATAMGPGGGSLVGCTSTPTSISDGGRRAVIRSCDSRKVRFSATPGRQPEVDLALG